MPPKWVVRAFDYQGRLQNSKVWRFRETVSAAGLSIELLCSLISTPLLKSMPWTRRRRHQRGQSLLATEMGFCILSSSNSNIASLRASLLQNFPSQALNSSLCKPSLHWCCLRTCRYPGSTSQTEAPVKHVTLRRDEKGCLEGCKYSLTRSKKHNEISLMHCIINWCHAGALYSQQMLPWLHRKSGCLGRASLINQCSRSGWKLTMCMVQALLPFAAGKFPISYFWQLRLDSDMHLPCKANADTLYVCSFMCEECC